VAGRVESGSDAGAYQWLLDDRSGEGALGGVCWVHVALPPDGWECFTDWRITIAEAAEVLDSTLTWLSPSDSEAIVALLPLRSARLERLTCEGSAAELLAREGIDSIARAWMRYTRADPSDAGRMQDWWAVETWMRSDLWQDEDRYRAGLLHLIDAATTTADLDNVGAGPLEDFIAAEESRIVWIEEQATNSPGFRRALANVRIWNLPDPLFDRLERAAGVKLGGTGVKLGGPDWPRDAAKHPNDRSRQH
jgi:hypothetical protein